MLKTIRFVQLAVVMMRNHFKILPIEEADQEKFLTF